MGRKKKIRILMIVFATLFVLLNVLAGIHAYKFTHFTGPSATKTKPPEELSLGEKIITLIIGPTIPKPTNEVLPANSFEIVHIQSTKRLEGWLIEVPDDKGLVILFHGFTSSKSKLLTYSQAFNELGYSTLLVDFHGSGGSEGNTTTFGYRESEDVNAVFQYTQNRFPQQEIILFGSSMGAVAIMKAFKDESIQPLKIILECPFGSMKQTVKTRFHNMGLPGTPFAEILMIYGGLFTGTKPFSIKSTEYAKAINVPVLLLLGLQDPRVSVDEIDKIYANIDSPKNLVILENSAHENYLLNDRGDWIDAVKFFLSH